MTKMNFQLKRLYDDEIQVTVFIGEKDTTVQRAGQLNLTVGEWQVFGAALLLGQERMQGQFITEVEGEEEALR
jgi:hypothetical protein